MNPDINIVPADSPDAAQYTTPQITTPQQILKPEFLFLQSQNIKIHRLQY